MPRLGCELRISWLIFIIRSLSYRGYVILFWVSWHHCFNVRPWLSVANYLWDIDTEIVTKILYNIDTVVHSLITQEAQLIKDLFWADSFYTTPFRSQRKKDVSKPYSNLNWIIQNEINFVKNQLITKKLLSFFLLDSNPWWQDQ